MAEKNEALENFEKLVEGSKRGEVFLTMADIYRKARLFWQLQDFKFGNGRSLAPDHRSITIAVNVSRWFPIIGALENTEYGTVKLVWRNGTSYLSMEFFPTFVRTLKIIDKNYADVYEQTQHCTDKIGIDMLWSSVVQFCAENGSPTAAKPVLYDELEGTDIPDLDMSVIEKKEAEVLESIRASLREKEVKENGETATIPETAAEEENKEDIGAET